MFERLSSFSLSQQAADQIRGLILGQRLKPGDQLPGERELMRELGISRGVAREAIRLLQAQGLVQVMPGKGTFVKGLGQSFITGAIGAWAQEGRGILAELLEARMIVETQLASLAAERATKEHLDRMAAAHQDMDRAVQKGDISEMAYFDVAFHEAIAQGAHNRVLVRMLASVTEPLFSSRLASLSLPGRPGVVLRRHEAILNSILAHDAEEARRAMMEHLITARDELREAVPDLLNPDRG